MSGVDERRRVLVVPEWYPSEGDPVTGSWARARARALARRHDVAVVLTEAGSPELAEDRMDGDVRTIRIGHTRSSIVAGTSAARLAATLAAVRRLRDDGFVPDIVHAVEYSAALDCVPVAWRADTPLVVSEHYTGFLRGAISGREALKARLGLNLADVVCPDSADLGRHLHRLGVRTSIRPMPNLVDDEQFVPTPFPAEAPGGEVRMLNVATLDPKKDHALLLEALALAREDAPELVLEIVGDGPLRGELEGRARQLGLGASVRFHGAVPPEEIAQLLRRVSYFVLSSKWENLPHVLIEALMSGRPVVSTSVGGVSEIVEANDGILVPAGRPADLAAAISAMRARYASYDPVELADRARARFGEEVMLRRWSELYAELIASRRARRRGVGRFLRRRRAAPPTAR